MSFFFTFSFLSRKMEYWLIRSIFMAIFILFQNLARLQASESEIISVCHSLKNNQVVLMKNLKNSDSYSYFEDIPRHFPVAPQISALRRTLEDPAKCQTLFCCPAGCKFWRTSQPNGAGHKFHGNDGINPNLLKFYRPKKS